MKNSRWLLLAGLVIMMMTVGCEKQMGFIAPEGDDVDAAATSTLPIQYNPGGSWFTYFYYMPGSGTAGTPVVYPMSIANDDGSNGCGVSVWDDGVNIYVQYNTAPNWWLTQVHVDIGTAHDSLRHNGSGNLQPGQFRFPSDKQFNINPYVQQKTVTCEWQSSWVAGVSPWEQGDQGYDPTKGLLLCAHSIVCQRVWDEVTQSWIWVNFQTGTGAGGPPPPPPGKRPVLLPPATTWVTMSATHPYPGGLASWDVLLSNVPGNGPFDPYNVWNGHWKGWCAEYGVDYYGQQKQVHLISSYDPTLNTYPRLWREHWDWVNWLLNHKDLYPSALYTDFQTAFYLILGEYPLEQNVNVLARQMYDDAAANGENYPIPAGGWIAVLLYDGNEEPFPTVPPTDQLIFIEVDP